MNEYYMTKQGGRNDYKLKEFTVNTDADIAKLPTDDSICPGSSAIVISSSEVYMLNTKKRWQKVGTTTEVTLEQATEDISESSEKTESEDLSDVLNALKEINEGE